MIKKTLLNTSIVACTLFSLQSWACGCVDAPMALVATEKVNMNYLQADSALAKALSGLGDVVKQSYEAMNQGAVDVERIGRLKQAQAVTSKGIAFHTQKNAEAESEGNKISAIGVEADIFRAEKAAVLKSTTLNKKSFLEE